MSNLHHTPKLTKDDLHSEIMAEYSSVANDSGKGYHFHTGRAAPSEI